MLQALFPEALDWRELALRLGVAVLAGAAIGWDRQRSGKSAGMRTHMLVSLGACLFVLVPLGRGASGEAMSRTIQGVATGIGFIGGGVILHHMRQDEHTASVKGMTSAAALWLTAALGVVAGAGLWTLVVLAVAAAMLILAGGKPLERLLFRKPADDDQS
jgi:putative Mg2+ transporter-C (MgtC) family protein